MTPEDRRDRLALLSCRPDLKGVIWRRMAYRLFAPDWDHDHCVGCGSRFSTMVEGDLTDGWATTEDYSHGPEYEWVCVECSAEFRDLMHWRAARAAAD